MAAGPVPVLWRLAAAALLLAALRSHDAAAAAARGRGHALRRLQQAGAPQWPANATRGPAPLQPPPPTDWAAQLARAAAPAVDTSNGAFLGCFDRRRLDALDPATQRRMNPITGCRKHCEDRFFSFAVVMPQGSCVCSQEIPAEAARLPNAVCDAAGARAHNGSSGGADPVAVYYLAYYSAIKGCRIVEVPMQASEFRFAYNQDKATFGADGVLTLRMDGDSGTRLYYPLTLEYGLVSIDAKVSGASGVVTAFYLRSDTWQETGDFSELDFEFLNAHPGKPGSLWTNSFKGGVSFGEQLFTVPQYQAATGAACQPTLTSGSSTDGGCWYNFKIHWQPSHVAWLANNRLLRRNYWGGNVTWCDMLGKCTIHKSYRPPDRPSYPTLSIWSDTWHNGAFGGRLVSSSPNFSIFRRLRLVACDQPLPAANGPAWARGRGGGGGGQRRRRKGEQGGPSARRLHGSTAGS